MTLAEKIRTAQAVERAARLAEAEAILAAATIRLRSTRN